MRTLCSTQSQRDLGRPQAARRVRHKVPNPPAGPQTTMQIKTLERELRRKDKALAESGGLLVLPKKPRRSAAQDLWNPGDQRTHLSALNPGRGCFE